MAKTSGGVRLLAEAKPKKAAQQKIAQVISDIRKEGYSKQQPFSIGYIESRMTTFATTNGIELPSKSIYMSAHFISHALRDSKTAKGIAIKDTDLISFPGRRYTMDLYYDGKSFVYTDNKIKFIINPNYEMKISRKKTKKVAFITAGKTSMREFKMKKYRKI